MSVSFIVDVEMPRSRRVEPCLCAQMAPLFGALFRGECDEWSSLAEHAAPGCAQCGGTGVERLDVDERPQVNFANENAHIIARAMGLDLGHGIGSTDLATLRRGLIRARNVRSADELRAPETAPGRILAGYTSDDLQRALARLDWLVSEAQRLGVRRILWE